MPPALPTYLPGTLTLAPGTARDYRGLSRFHYLAGPPATWFAVRVIRFAPHARENEGTNPPPSASRVIAVAVLSWPTVCSRGRERALGLKGLTYGAKARLANANVRTISRVIVHPQFRALGLSTHLIRALIDACPTRYVEATARMGRAHPLFERAGMTRHDPQRDDDPVYYLLDKQASAPNTPPKPTASAADLLAPRAEGIRP